MGDFSITSRRAGNVTIVIVSGRVDSVTARTMDVELAKIARERKKIALELSGVVYLSSAGVRAIINVLHNVQKSEGGVKLACVPEAVAEVLETVGVMELLQAYPSVEEAIASF